MSRVCCYSNCYGPFGVWAAVECVREAGIATLELALRAHNLGGLIIPEEAVITEQTDESRVRDFQNQLANHGVEVACCNVGGDALSDIGVAHIELRLKCARRWFGVSLVVSNVGQPTTKSEREKVNENLARLGDAAAALGIVIALETHKGPTQNAAVMTSVMSELRHPNIGINFDTGNIAYYNESFEPCRELEAIAPWVRNVHLKDNRGGFGDWYFPALGEGGAVDFRRVREILDTVGYPGSFTIELEGIGDEPEQGLEVRQERVRRSVEHLRACGYDV